MGLERDMGMEGTWVWKRTRVWKGHGYRGDMGMEGPMVWREHGYGRDMGM